MPKKSLISTTTIDIARKAHACKANRKHQISKGDARLKVKNGRSHAHYCKACGLAILEQDIAKLKKLLAQLDL